MCGIAFAHVGPAIDGPLLIDPDLSGPQGSDLRPGDPFRTQRPPGPRVGVARGAVIGERGQADLRRLRPLPGRA